MSSVDLACFIIGTGQFVFVFVFVNMFLGNNYEYI
jgi:hypothetical protein